MPATQYPPARDLDLVKRLKIVATLQGFGFSPSKIAEELQYSVREAKKDVAAVVDRHRNLADLDSYLKDVTARTGEQLASLQKQREIICKQLDWASEWVQAMVPAADGSNYPEIDAKGNKVFGPRKPSMVISLVNQLASTDRQIADVLGLMHKNVDITVTLEKTERTQVIILDILKDAAPELYNKVVRQIQAVLSSVEGTRLSLTGGKERKIEDVIEADYVEVEHSTPT